MKKILLIGTGGTISCKEGSEGLEPLFLASELLKYCPAIKNMCDVTSVQAMNIDSSNIRPSDWLTISNIIHENYDKYDGFVITHGTDTMAYTASALSYLIQNSKKPIVITGAQKPISEDGTDAIKNVLDAFTVAIDDDSHDVSLVFFGSVIAGTRARKTYSKSFQAFESINYPIIARVNENKLIHYIKNEITSDVKFFDHINPNVGVLKFVPGMRNDVVSYLVDAYDGIIVETFGVGGLPEYSDFYTHIKRAINLNKIVVMATQVSNEGSDLSVYKVGMHIKNSLKILESYDMTTESMFTKLMWILANTKDFNSAKDLFYKNINHDIMMFS